MTDRIAQPVRERERRNEENNGVGTFNLIFYLIENILYVENQNIDFVSPAVN